MTDISFAGAADAATGVTVDTELRIRLVDSAGRQIGAVRTSDGRPVTTDAIYTYDADADDWTNAAGTSLGADPLVLDLAGQDVIARTDAADTYYRVQIRHPDGHVESYDVQVADGVDTVTFYSLLSASAVSPDDIVAGRLIPSGGGSGQVLAKSSATDYAVEWTTGSGAGDVVGPSSVVDESLTRFDETTGKLLQSTPLLVSDSDGTTVTMQLDDNTELLHVAVEPGSDKTGVIFGRVSAIPNGVGFGSYTALFKAPASGTYNHAAGFVAGKSNGEIVHFYNHNTDHLLRINTDASNELEVRGTTAAGATLWHLSLGADPYMVFGGASADRVGANEVTVVGSVEATVGITVGGIGVVLPPPSDGNYYAYKDGAWVDITSSITP
jgi:hypothetical protein